jgi:riboflavin-specific deaminase-like protein
MSGARTVDLGLVDLGPGPARFRKTRLKKGLPEFNLRVVVSGRATLNPEAEIFRHRFSPIIILTTTRAPKRNVERLRRAGAEVRSFGEDELDFRTALRWLHAEWHVRHLLCEGGGEVNAGLFQHGVVDEIYLTVSPLIFGGRDAPTMADGHGVAEVTQATRLRLISLRRFGDELFLVYRVRKTAPGLRLKAERSSETQP